MALPQILQALTLAAAQPNNRVRGLSSDAPGRLPSVLPTQDVRSMMPGGAGVSDDSGLLAFFNTLNNLIPATDGGGPPTTAGTPLGAPPTDYRALSAAARERQRQALSAYGSVATPAPRGIAFRTPDLLALGLAGLAGDNGGQILGGYLQGKGQAAEQATQRDYLEAERRRQAFGMKANAAATEAGSYDDAAEKQDLYTQQRALNERKEQGLDNRAEMKAIYGLQQTGLTIDERRRAHALMGQNVQFKQGMEQLMDQAPESRRFFAGQLRLMYPETFGQWTDASLEQFGALTLNDRMMQAKTSLLDEQRRKAVSDIGYRGVLTEQLQKMMPGQLDKLAATTAKINAAARAAAGRFNVSEAQAAKIEEETRFIEPQFRIKASEGLARAARFHNEAMRGDETALRQSVNAYNTMATVGRGQADSILKRYRKGHEPDPTSADGIALGKARQLTQVGQDGLLALEGKVPSGPTLNPDTHQRISPPPPGGSIVYTGKYPNGNVPYQGKNVPISKVIAWANLAIAQGANRSDVMTQLRKAGVTQVR